MGSFLGESSDSDGHDASKKEKSRDKLRVNKQFAEQFESHKRAQALARLKEIESDEEGSDSSDEEEDDDGELLTPELDLKIMKTINMIRSKDPRIYDKSTVIFEKPASSTSDDSDAENENGFSETDGVPKARKATKATKRAAKPLKYKDVVREQILAADTAEDAISSDSDAERRGLRDGGEAKDPKLLAYDKEQQLLRDSFLQGLGEKKGGKKLRSGASSGETPQQKANGRGAGGSGSGGSDGAASSSDDDQLFKVRIKTPAEKRREEEEMAEEVARLRSDDPEQAKADAFLRDFVLQKRWKEAEDAEKSDVSDGESGGGGGGGAGAVLGGGVSDSEDGEELDRADEFEAKYNFRFEEEGGAQITSHARSLPNAMRRPDERRKKAREARKERKSEERRRKEEELRRLKKIKREAIMARLAKIRDESGGAEIDAAELDADFDPDKWAETMQQAFGEDYYSKAALDDGWEPGDDPLEGIGDGPEAQELQGGGEEAADGDGGEFERGGEGFGYDEGAAAAGGEGGGGEQEDARGYGDDGYEEEGGEEEAEDYQNGHGADGGGQEGRQNLLDELYKLDYEDLIGDLPCRFKYRSVQPETFGLSTEEVLLADDKELSKYVSVKKLAPYSGGGSKGAAHLRLDARKRRRLRQHIKEVLAESAAKREDAPKRKRKRGRKESIGSEDGANGDQSDDGDNKSRSEAAVANVGGKGKAATAAVAAAASKAAEAGNGHASEKAVGSDSLDEAALQEALEAAPSASDVAEPLGGRRKRRKKAGKKMRKGAGAADGSEGAAEADMVPKVQAFVAKTQIPAPAAAKVNGAVGPAAGARACKSARKAAAPGAAAAKAAAPNAAAPVLAAAAKAAATNAAAPVSTAAVAAAVEAAVAVAGVGKRRRKEAEEAAAPVSAAAVAAAVEAAVAVAGVGKKRRKGPAEAAAPAAGAAHGNGKASLGKKGSKKKTGAAPPVVIAASRLAAYGIK